MVEGRPLPALFGYFLGNTPRPVGTGGVHSGLAGVGDIRTGSPLRPGWCFRKPPVGRGGEPARNHGGDQPTWSGIPTHIQIRKCANMAESGVCSVGCAVPLILTANTRRRACIGRCPSCGAPLYNPNAEGLSLLTCYGLVCASCRAPVTVVNRAYRCTDAESLTPRQRAGRLGGLATSSRHDMAAIGRKGGRPRHPMACKERNRSASVHLVATLISVTTRNAGGNFLKITWHVIRCAWTVVNFQKLPITSRRYRKADRFGAVHFRRCAIAATIGSRQANEMVPLVVRYHLVYVRASLPIKNRFYRGTG